MIDDTLYTGWSDQKMYARTWNGSRFGIDRSINLQNNTGFATDLTKIRMMFYDRVTGRMYFNQLGDSKLYYRYFTSENPLVGGIRYEASAAVSGLSWGDLKGAFLVGDKLYVTTSDGKMQSVSWQNSAPVSGTLTTVSGPGVDSVDWRGQAIFLSTK